MESLLISEIQQKSLFNLPYVYSTICICYPLTLKEIIGLGQINYSSYLSILTMDEFDIIRNIEKRGIKLRPEDINVFKFLIDSAKQNYSFLLELQNAFRTFIREEIIVLFDEYKIVIGDGTDKRFLTEENFGTFQNIIRVQNKRDVVEDPPKDETPLRRKFRLKAMFRDSVKRNQVSNDPNAPDLCALITALCCYSGKTPMEIRDYSFFAFKNSFENYQNKEKYELDIRSILAGADPKKVKPTPWIKKTSN